LDYAKLANKLMLQWIQGVIDLSEKLYLIQGSREPQKDNRPAPETLQHGSICQW
jgi:hypothetical protein